MWPIDQIRARRLRTYNAAVIALLGHYQFERLDQATRHRVDVEVDQMLGQVPVSKAGVRANAGWAGLAAHRALAMWILRIPPIAGGRTWDEWFRPWSISVLSWFDNRQNKVAMDFRPFDPITEEVKDFLREYGLNISTTDPWQPIELRRL